MKFGWIVSQVNAHRLRDLIFDLNLHFQDGGHSVISRNGVFHLVSEHEASAGTYAAASVSSWSIVHSYLFQKVFCNVCNV